jgi:hypothetical protein
MAVDDMVSGADHAGGDADVSWAPETRSGEERTALVLDLPGAEGVAVGVALARRGYRPVPLYNAHPGPAGASAIDVASIAAALVAAVAPLRMAKIPLDTPPAFLLDANRRYGARVLWPGMFDNRSVSFPTDFPSGAMLVSRGIRRAILVLRGAVKPQADLAHTLRRWQAAGVSVLAIDLASADKAAVTCEMSKPSRLTLWWHVLTAAMGLRRNPLGGFGGRIPEPSAG